MSRKASGGHQKQAMAHKSDFSPTEWNTLRDTPHIVCTAVLLIGSNAFTTIAELLGLSRLAIENQFTGATLTRSLTSSDEVERAQVSIKQTFRVSRGIPTVESIRRRALELAKSSSAITAARSDPMEAKEYCNMLYRVAERVAATAREKSIVGFGEEATDALRAFLDELRLTLGVELARRA